MGSDEIALGTKADFSNLRRELEKTKQAFVRMEKAMKATTKENTRLERENRKVGKAHKETFGDRGVARLASYASGALSIGAAIGVIHKITATLNAEIDRGVQSIIRSESAVARLATLGGGPAAFQRRTAAVKRTRTEYGIQVEEASALQFAVESAEDPRTRDLFARLHPALSPSAMARNINLARKAIGPAAPSPVVSLAMTMAAAEKSPLDPEQFAPEITAIAGAGKLVGATPVELYAALASMAGPAGGGPAASTQINALMKTIAKKGFEGGDFETSMGRLSKFMAGKSAAQQFKQFGRQEGVKGLSSWLMSAAHRKRITPGIESAFAGDVSAITDFEAALMSDPEQRLARDRRIAQERFDVAKQGTGEVSAQMRVDTAKLRARAAWATPGGGVGFAISRGAAELDQWLRSWDQPKETEAADWEKIADALERVVARVPGAATLGGREDITTTHTGFGGPEK